MSIVSWCNLILVIAFFVAVIRLDNALRKEKEKRKQADEERDDWQRKAISWRGRYESSERFLDSFLNSISKFPICHYRVEEYNCFYRVVGEHKESNLEINIKDFPFTIGDAQLQEYAESEAKRMCVLLNAM